MFWGIGVSRQIYSIVYIHNYFLGVDIKLNPPLNYVLLFYI
jgi:hypothetical protein